MKGYLVRWKSRAKDDHKTIDYWFSTSPLDGATWDQRAVAEIEIMHFNRSGVTIPSAEGGSYTIRNFVVEERADGKFVVSCEGPFILKDRPAQTGVEGEDASA